jgi:hypothetical protein
VCERAQQDQAEVDDGVHRDVEEEDGRQPDDWKQTAKKHDPEMAFLVQ